MHGGKLSGLKVALLFFIILIEGALASNQYKYKKIDNLISTQKIKLSKLERKIAINFNSLYKLSHKGIYNKKLTSRLHKDLKKSKVFYSYTSWTQRLIRIQNTNSFSKLKDYCTKLSLENSDDLVINELIRNTTVHCFNKYLNKLKKFTSYKISFHQRQIGFFKRNVYYLNIYTNRKAMISFLDRLKDSSTKHKLYSSAVSNYLENFNAVPSKRLIKSLHITPRFTAYLQSKDINKYSTELTFYREFKKLMKNALNFADENPGSKKIKQLSLDTFSYYEKTLKFQNKKRLNKSLLSFGKSLSRRKEYSLARQAFSMLLKGETRLKHKVVFEYLWTFIVKENYDDGLEAIANFIKDSSELKSNSKLHFWVGYAYDKDGEENKAKEIFQDLIRSNPLSYYAILAAKKLSRDRDEKTQEIYLSLVKDQKNINLDRSVASTKIDYRWLRRIIGWSYVNNNTFLNLEINNVKHIKSGKDLNDHLLSAAFSLSTKKDYLESFKVIYRSVESKALNVDKNALKILFPQPYFKQIRNKTKDFDPIIALSLIRQESGFNTRARSHVGARGLMQLMPNTAKRFKRWVKKRHLYNPKLNIQIGTKYFNNLLKRYDQNLVYSLAAYNAGEGRVDDWQEQYLTSNSILENIENIPFLETRKYVKLIFRNIFFYKMLFNNKKEDGESYNKIYDIKLGFNN